MSAAIFRSTSLDPLLLGLFWTLIAALVFAVSPGARLAAEKRAKAPDASPTIRTITPVFDQLVSFPLPKSFVPVYQTSNQAQYIQESVPVGETVEDWTQMITLTGHKGLALKQNVSAQFIAGQFVSTFQKLCPSSFSGVNMGPLKIDSVDSASVVISCGDVAKTTPPFNKISESTLLMVVRGRHDF